MSKIKDTIAEIENQLSDDTVEFVVGNEKKKRRGSSRRIHFYRRGGPVEIFHGSGTTEFDSPYKRVSTPYFRLANIEAHVFAEDETVTEQLLDNLITAIWNSVSDGGFFIKDYEWEGDQINQRGDYAILSFDVKYPVVGEGLPLLNIEDTEIECEIESKDD